MEARAAIRALALAALVPSLAPAGSLLVGATRVDISGAHPVAVVEVQNTGDSRTLAQVDSFDWAQRDGEDVLTPTTALIASPMIMDLAPGERRKVRIGLRDSRPGNEERTYRVIIGEVPQPEIGGNGLRFVVRMSVPVFVQPSALEPASKAVSPLSWSITAAGGGCAQLIIRNASDWHVHILRAELYAASGKLLWNSAGGSYALARSQRNLEPRLCERAPEGELTLKVTSDRGPLDVARNASPSEN